MSNRFKAWQTKYKKWLTILALIAVGAAIFALGWYAEGIYEERRQEEPFCPWDYVDV